MASRAPKTAPRRPREPPRRLLYASRAVPAPPRTPLRPPKTSPRLSKILQDGSVSLQDVSKSSPEEVFEAPSRLQELSRGAFQASHLLETLCCKQEVFGNGSGSAGTAQRIRFDKYKVPGKEENGCILVSALYAAISQKLGFNRFCPLHELLA